VAGPRKIKTREGGDGGLSFGHPLEDYKLEMSNFCTSPVSELEQFKNQDVAVAGIVVGVENRISKNGKPFGTFSIEDFSGTTEMVLFGEDYLRLKHFLAEGSLLFIKGKYQLRFNADDRFELKISSIQLLQEVREKLTKKVTFNIA
jgi:DNA polymerase-3 subunit alpha